MSSTRETPKKLVAVLEHKTSLCSDDHCRLCRCSFKVQKGGKFQHISTENLYKLPGKKGVEKRPLDKLLSEDLGLHLSNNPNYSSRVCAKCALKIRNAVELVRFLKANLNHVVANVKETSVECQQSVIGYILTNQILRCWADGGFETLKRVCRRFFLVSPSSPLGQTTLVTLLISRSQSLSARPSDP